MSPYSVSNDPYIDDQTGVLRNKLGYATEEELDAAESDFASSEIAIIIQEMHRERQELTAELFLGLHKQIFGALYDWAGQLRTVEVSKGATSFARVEYLEANLRQLLEELLTDEYWQADSREQLVARLAYYYGELNVLHPFREGNGRTIRTFLSLMADGRNHYIAWDEMTGEENIQASIASYNGDDAPLVRLLSRIVHGV